MKKTTLPPGGGSYVRTKEGKLVPNPDNQPASKDAPASVAKTAGNQTPKKGGLNAD